MHELSIAQSIVSLAESYASNHNATVIEEIELEIGRLAGVELQTLEFALDSAVKGTLLEKARIIRHYIDGEALCSECEATFPTDNLFAQCPRCGSWWISITKGKELRLKSLVVN